MRPLNSDPTVARSALAADYDVIQRGIAGNSADLEQLFTTNARKFYRIAFSVLRNREDAEDALQDSWFRAYSNLESFEGRSSFSTWVTRIVINSALLILRKHRGIREVPTDMIDEDGAVSSVREVPDDSPNPEQSYVEGERIRVLKQAVCKLRPRLRAVIEFGQLRDLSMEETARELGITVQATKGRFFHARTALRRSAALRTLVMPAAGIGAGARQRPRGPFDGARRKNEKRLMTVELIARGDLMFES